MGALPAVIAMSTEPNRLETQHFIHVRREESISKLLIE